jgi:hypothetical protein
MVSPGEPFHTAKIKANGKWGKEKCEAFPGIFATKTFIPDRKVIFSAFHRLSQMCRRWILPARSLNLI